MFYVISFFVPNCFATIYLSLRRTLVRSVRYSTKWW